MLITLSRKIYAAGFSVILSVLGVLFSIDSSLAQTAEKIDLLDSQPQHRRHRSLCRQRTRDSSATKASTSTSFKFAATSRSPRRLSGQVQATNGVGTVIRALERSELPMKILTVSLKRNLFWLVARTEITSIAQLKGKTLGTTTLGGSQHSAAMRLIRKGGVDEKDITVVVGGDVPAQLQSLVGRTIDVAALSPPTVILARDKYQYECSRVGHGRSGESSEWHRRDRKISAREKRSVEARSLRARMKANRYFMENERGTSEVLAKYQNVELAVALESYRLAKPAFTVERHSFG